MDAIDWGKVAVFCVVYQGFFIVGIVVGWKMAKKYYHKHWYVEH